MAMSTQETERDVKSLVTPLQQTKLKEQQEQYAMSSKEEAVSAMKELDIVEKYFEALIDLFSSGLLVLNPQRYILELLEVLLRRTYPLLDHKGWMKNPSEEKWHQFPFDQLKDLERLFFLKREFPDSSIEVVKMMVWHTLLINTIKNKTSAAKDSIGKEMQALDKQDLEKESEEELLKSLSKQPLSAQLSSEEREGLRQMIVKEKEIKKRWNKFTKKLPHPYQTEPYFWGMLWALLFVVKELKTLCQTGWLEESDLSIPYEELSTFFKQCHYLLDHHDEFTNKFRESMEVVYKLLRGKSRGVPASEQLYKHFIEQDLIREIEKNIAAIRDETKSRLKDVQSTALSKPVTVDPQPDLPQSLKPDIKPFTAPIETESDCAASLVGSLTNGSPNLNGTLPQNSSPSLSNTGNSKCLTATATTEE